MKSSLVQEYSSHAERGELPAAGEGAPVDIVDAIPISSESAPPAAAVPLPQEHTFHGVPMSRLSEELSSKEFRNLESYILQLESSEKWKQYGSSEGIEGFKLSRSKFSSEVPVLRVHILFGSGVTPEFALNMFGEPHFRQAWDQRISQMNKIYNPQENCFLHYHEIKFNAPLKNREFLTLYYMRKVGNEYRVVLRSTKHKVIITQEFPERETIERAKIFFGMYRVFEEPEGTRMTIIMQFNLYLPLKRAEELAPDFILKWLGKYKAQTDESAKA